MTVERLWLPLFAGPGYTVAYGLDMSFPHTKEVKMLKPLAKAQLPATRRRMYQPVIVFDPRRCCGSRDTCRAGRCVSRDT